MVLQTGNLSNVCTHKHRTREKDDYRTEEVNSVFKEIALCKGDTGNPKKGKTDFNIRFSNWVGPLGIEPSTHRL